MQHTHLRHAIHHPHHVSTPFQVRLPEMSLFIIAVLLFAMIMLPVMSSDTGHLVQLFGLNPPVPETTARDSNTNDAVRKLVQTLKGSEPASQRDLALNVLKDTPESAVPILMDALNDSDSGVRTGVAQILGMRRAYQAIAALELATHDPQASVRSAATRSLGEIDAWQYLPRLKLLASTDSDTDVREAAYSAIEMLKAEFAKEIGIPNSELVDVAVTASDPPQLYAVTHSNLYTRRGTAWLWVSNLPDVPLSLAIGSSDNLIYLATASLGLYRSLDSGVTWEHVQF